MARTLGLTGMDSATEAELRGVFAASRAPSAGWTLVPENEADLVIVDMDSMYGPMSWLRLHGADKRVVGLTNSARTQADYCLQRPPDAAALDAVLESYAAEAGLPHAPPVAAPVPAAPVPAPVVTMADLQGEGTPAGFTHAPEPADRVPEETAAPAATAEAARNPPPVEAAPPPPPRETTLADWLGDAGTGRFRFRREGGPTLLVDPAAGKYHGPAALKPLGAYFSGRVDASDLEPVDEAEWIREVATLGAGQPLARLHWLAGLLAGGGHLLPGYDSAARFVLGKWPQTEREFPKHFRIATAMMKGPATIWEISQASTVPVEEVSDFINANLATGFAEQVAEAGEEPVEPRKPGGGLFGRMRGR